MSQPTEVEPTEKQRAAFQGGRDAFVAGFPSDVCPHPIVDEVADPEQLGRLWVRGWVKAKHDAQGPPRAPRREPPAGLPKATV